MPEDEIRKRSAGPSPERDAAGSNSRELETAPGSATRPAKDGPENVQVLDGALGLFTTPEIGLETEEEIKTRSELSRVVNRMLILGLIFSTTFLFIGLALSAVRRYPLPANVSGFRQIADGLETGFPPSFLSLGILLLIATPVLRVVGLLLEFAGKRDWRYAAITSVVLAILLASVALGSG